MHKSLSACGRVAFVGALVLGGGFVAADTEVGATAAEMFGGKLVITQEGGRVAAQLHERPVQHEGSPLAAPTPRPVTGTRKLVTPASPAVGSRPAPAASKSPSRNGFRTSAGGRKAPEVRRSAGSSGPTADGTSADRGSGKPSAAATSTPAGNNDQAGGTDNGRVSAGGNGRDRGADRGQGRGKEKRSGGIGASGMVETPGASKKSDRLPRGRGRLSAEARAGAVEVDVRAARNRVDAKSLLGLIR